MRFGRQILSGAFASAFFTAVSVFVSAIQLRWVLHYLSKESAGIWILFLTIGAYITLFDLGLSPTLGREISFVLGGASLSVDRPDRIRVLLKTCSTILTIISAVILLAAVSGGWLFFSSRSSHLGTHLYLAWIIFSFGSCVNLWGSAAFAGLFGIGEIAAEKFVRAISLLIGLAVYWAVLRAGFGILGLAIAWVGQGFLARGLAWWTLNCKVSLGNMTSVRVDWASAVAMISPSLRFAAIQLGAILILQSANLVIAARLGAAAVPPYESVSKIATTLMTLSLLTVLSSTPFVSQAFAARDSATVEYLLRSNLRFGMPLLIFMGSFAAVFGRDVVNVWLGPGVFPGNPVLWTLLVMVVLEVHHVIYASTMMATGEIVFVIPAIAAGLLTVVIGFILAGRLGLWGVALGILIAQLTTNNWYAPWLTAKFFSIRITSLLPNVYAPIAVFTAIQIAADMVLRRSLPNSGRLVALVGLALAATVIAVLSFAYVICTKDERTRLIRLLIRSVRAQSLKPIESRP